MVMMDDLFPNGTCDKDGENTSPHLVSMGKPILQVCGSSHLLLFFSIK